MDVTDTTLDEILFSNDYWFYPRCKYAKGTASFGEYHYIVCTNPSMVKVWGNKGHIGLRQYDTLSQTLIYIGVCEKQCYNNRKKRRS